LKNQNSGIINFHEKLIYHLYFVQMTQASSEFLIIIESVFKLLNTFIFIVCLL